MPELIEVEMYRRDMDALVGERVDSIRLLDRRAIRPKGTLRNVLTVLEGMTLTGTSRHGKLLIAEFEDAAGVSTLGLRFAMTGRLLVNGASSIEQLEYSSAKNDPSWDRFEMVLGGSSVALRDQRCLGSVELDPSTVTLGPEASTVTAMQLSRSFEGRRKALKAALLDQSILAGLGNLLADEVLWEAGLSPLTTIDELTPAHIGQLADQVRSTVSELSNRGGSNTGRSFSAREAGASCPKCSGAMRRDRVGGRTAWWCLTHQL